MDNRLKDLSTKGVDDRILHKKRRMFCISKNVVFLAPKETTQSHIEWFLSSGMVADGNSMQNFLQITPRGFYLVETNSVYCYQGIGFEFSETTEQALISNLDELYSKLNLDQTTKLFLGPKDTVIGEHPYQQRYLGTVEKVRRRDL